MSLREIGEDGNVTVQKSKLQATYGGNALMEKDLTVIKVGKKDHLRTRLTGWKHICRLPPKHLEGVKFRYFPVAPVSYL